jgi:GumC protein
MSEKTDLNITELIAIVKRQKWIFLTIFFTVLICAIIVSLVIPAIYKATAKIIVQNEPNLYAIGFIPNASEDRVFLNTQKEIILSEIILGKALKQMQKDGILQQYDYDKIKKKVDIDYLNESNILEVSVFLFSSLDASKFANDIVKTFLEYQASSKAELVDKILEVIKKETAVLKEDIDNLKTQLKDLSDKEKLSFYQAQVPFFMNNIQEIDRRNMSVESGIERIKEELKLANREQTLGEPGSNYPIMSSVLISPSNLAESNNQLPTSYVASVPWLQEMKKKVADSQSELSLLLGQYKEGHPDVQEMRSKISMLQASLGEELKKVLSNYSDYYNGHIQYLEAQKKTNDEERSRYSSELEKLSLSMDQASSKQIEFYALLKQYETKQDIYSLFLRKQNELQFLKAEAIRAGSPNIRVLEYAQSPRKPVSPNLLVNILIGLLFGFMLGVIGSLIKDKE